MDSEIENVPFRKQLRLKGYDYSKTGCYFITVCTQNHREILGEVVGGDAHIAPSVLLSDYGAITKKYIESINTKYEGIYLDKYVIMPNHFHLILVLDNGATGSAPSRRFSPSAKISIPQIVRSLKTLITKEAGVSLFQESYHDHIIRDEADYLTKWNYIDANPARWAEDDYYIKP